jgi:hypothetical protein
MATAWDSGQTVVPKELARTSRHRPIAYEDGTIEARRRAARVSEKKEDKTSGPAARHEAQWAAEQQAFFYYLSELRLNEFNDAIAQELTKQKYQLTPSHLSVLLDRAVRRRWYKLDPNYEHRESKQVVRDHDGDNSIKAEPEEPAQSEWGRLWQQQPGPDVVGFRQPREG